MSPEAVTGVPVSRSEPLTNRYQSVRAVMPELCRHLEPEDFVIQTMPDVSPAKWHLAHVTWFFEEFILKPFSSSYREFNENYHYLFNSYYVTAGQMHPRPKRGLLSRPLVQEILNYREHVDQAMLHLLDERGSDPRVIQRLSLGMHHEQQHQELLLTDIKHVFSSNPLPLAVNPSLKKRRSESAMEHKFISGSGGIHEIGFEGEDFCFDNETPRHPVLLPEYQIGSRLITNSEYREFIADGGYTKSGLWLSDGWSTVCVRKWDRPLYWGEDLESEFTLGGHQDLNPHAPVAHISYYEADAFARWAGARLPTEAEWEVQAAAREIDGNFQESEYWQPVPTTDTSPQFFGDVWEWTASPYSAYPGFRPLDGSLGEYNGKFMCNQMTVRGGSCVTARDHIRPEYRSFFYPDARWQFLGVRLAKDGDRA